MDNENIYDAVYKEENSNEKQSTSNYYNSNNKPKKRRGAMGKVVAIVVSCSLLGGITGSGVTYLMLKDSNNNNNTQQTNQDSSAKLDTTEVSFKKDGALSISEAFEKVSPAVVTISTKGVATFNGIFSQEVDGMGSGFIINEDGYILTNYHVIEGAKEVSVTLSDNRAVSAKVVNYDAEQDVAMLKITDDSIEVPAVVELGDSNALKQGEEVIAIGTPLSSDLSQTVTNGIVSALNRNVETDTGVQ